MSPTFDYHASQIDRVLSGGPDEETGGMFQLKICSASAETKWLLVTAEQVQAIRELLSDNG